MRQEAKQHTDQGKRWALFRDKLCSLYLCCCTVSKQKVKETACKYKSCPMLKSLIVSQLSTSASGQKSIRVSASHHKTEPSWAPGNWRQQSNEIGFKCTIILSVVNDSADFPSVNSAFLVSYVTIEDIYVIQWVYISRSLLGILYTTFCYFVELSRIYDNTNRSFVYCFGIWHCISST